MSREVTVPTVFVGTVTYDAIALAPRFPEPDERIVADDLGFAGGGPAATAAVAFARLGLPAAFIGAVGDDEQGERVRAGLAAEGVDTRGVMVVSGHPTAASVVIVDRGRAARAICTRPGPPLPELGPIGEELVSAVDWVHVDHSGWAPVSRHLRNRRGAHRRPRLCVDAGNPVPDLALPQVDLYVPTVAALRRDYGDKELDALLAAALADGARTVVATLGADGSVGVSADGARAQAPAPPVPDLVSTLGAGDVFHGALLASVVRGEPLADCLGYANVAAALSCRGLDGRSAIPGHNEVLAALATGVAGTATHRRPAAARRPGPTSQRETT